MVDVEVEKLFECAAAPNEKTEPELWMIWQGMDCMVQECQQTVVSRAGLYIRLKAIRTERHQIRYIPLKGYMDRKAVVEHARPWKQILMFYRAHAGGTRMEEAQVQVKKGAEKGVEAFAYCQIH